MRCCPSCAPAIRSACRETRELCCFKLHRGLVRCIVVSERTSRRPQFHVFILSYLSLSCCNHPPSVPNSRQRHLSPTLCNARAPHTGQAFNNSETLKLLASIELACYRSEQATADPKMHTKLRRRIERMVKEDRRRRHKRKREEEAMTEAFSRQMIV